MDNKAFINGKIYDVVTPEVYNNNKGYYDTDNVAVIVGEYVLPIKTCNYNYETVGYYINTDQNTGSIFNYIVFPRTPQEAEIYSVSHIADFSNVTNLREMVAEQEKIQADQMKFLIQSENIFKPVIDPINDEPLMVGFKQAISDKNIDINQYQSRFGPNGKDFNNDRRKLNGNRISLDKFISIANCFDMAVKVIIEDASKNVPNPIGHRIEVELLPKKN